MKNIILLSTCCTALALPFHCSHAADATVSAVKIGVYDSRAVAVAFVGSDAFNKQMAPYRAEHDKAKKAGDTEQLKKIDAQMQAYQALLHKQGFSTAPVADILKHIESSLPQIQKDAGVVALVSKWDEAGLKAHSGAEKVDVTERLVDAFHPTARQRKSALEIQKHKPISLADAEKTKD